MTDITRLEIELEDVRLQLDVVRDELDRSEDQIFDLKTELSDTERLLHGAEDYISELESEVSLLSTWQENTWPIVQTMATRSWVTVDGVCMMTHDGFCTPTLSPTGWVHSPTCWHERARTLLAANRNGE